MDMKTCIFLTLGLLVGSGSGYSIDRPAGSTDNLQPPPLTPTPYAHQVKPLPSSKPARLGIVPGTVPQALVAQLELSGFPGVLVTKVMPDSPAAKAGLQENDVMVKLGESIKVLEILPFSQVSGQMLLVTCSCGLLIGVLGSAISIRRYFDV